MPPRLPRFIGDGRLSKALLGPELRAAVEGLPIADAGHGVDRFGLSRSGAARGIALTRFLYEHWFRVVSHDIEHVPASGAAVLAANHSGTLPVDALMLAHDLVRNRGRVARIAMDWFVPGLPWVNLVFIRGGGFSGTRGNFHALLEAGELLLAFPEGVPGIGKPFAERYTLQTWRRGHAELAIRHGAPIVPVGVVGAEEQMPQIARIEGFHVMGAPYLPIPATPVPLPVRIHLWYGEPIPIPSLYRPEHAHDAVAVDEAAERVKLAVRGLLARGLAERRGVFR
ncbi:MAG: acyltransferase family protein [Alphaproteobacteria bacterium]|nr:acyltransferase family protein [Alphaproteobacteria bacterium]MCB9691133.1 acyltransferase family protein [Alphaproteobacteria bacterium]